MTNDRPKPGRPAQTTPGQVLDKLIRAATDILSEHSAETDFSMTQIALRAGVSKRTVYTVVESKEELIAHVIRRNVMSAISILDGAVPDAAAARDVLTRFLAQWAAVALAPLTVGIFVMAIRERSRFPGVGQLYYSSGRGNGQAQLAQWLTRMHGKGWLTVDDAVLTADLLLAMTTADHQRALALGIRTPPEPAEMARRIDVVVGLVFGPAREA